MRTMKNPVVVLIFQSLLHLLISGESHAQIMDVDNDYPGAASVGLNKIVGGNPLDDGDDVYSLRGSYRFFSGDLGLEAGLSYAEPTSAFVESRGTDADLLLVDFSVVWYANHKSLNKLDRKNGKPWHRNSRIKPELILFGGPGLAALAVGDPVTGADASKYFFTINAGFGAKFHWLSVDLENGRDHRTSRFFLRSEVLARWFTGSDGEVDWGVGLSLGYSFGNRPSLLSLHLKIHEACKATERYLSVEMEPALAGERKSAGETDRLSTSIGGYRGKLEELEARVVTCGAKCEKARTCLDDNIGKLNVALAKLRPSARGPS